MNTKHIFLPPACQPPISPQYACFFSKKNVIIFAIEPKFSIFVTSKDIIRKKMTQEEKTTIEEKIVDVLKTVYDPEIPVNIYDLGLIYKIDVKDDATVDIDMTFTAPTCPAADFILEDVRQKVDTLDGVKSATVNLVFEPAWDQSMLSEEAKLELGLE